MQQASTDAPLGAARYRARMSAPVPDGHKVTELLAAERTFLAWVRTSIAIASLGFVVAKFGLWLRELAVSLQLQTPSHSTSMSLPIGVAMMAFGALLAILAAWHFHLLCRSIERGKVRANRGLVLTVTVGIALLSVLMIGYMLATAQKLG